METRNLSRVRPGLKDYDIREDGVVLEHGEVVSTIRCGRLIQLYCKVGGRWSTDWYFIPELLMCTFRFPYKRNHVLGFIDRNIDNWDLFNLTWIHEDVMRPKEKTYEVIDSDGLNYTLEEVEASGTKEPKVRGGSGRVCSKRRR